jgi:hypothetical protein
MLNVIALWNFLRRGSTVTTGETATPRPRSFAVRSASLEARSSNLHKSFDAKIVQRMNCSEFSDDDSVLKRSIRTVPSNKFSVEQPSGSIVSVICERIFGWGVFGAYFDTMDETKKPNEKHSKH